MTRPLVGVRGSVEHRLRLLEQRLNDELGFRDQRLRFTKRPMRSGPIVWVLRNEKVEAAGAIFPRGVVAEIAPASDDESILYFGYNEEWRFAGSGKIEFVSSNLRFVIAGVEEMPDLRFRLEWAGATNEPNAVAYPGAGAAHPHWQFDVDPGWLNQSPEYANVAEAAAIDVDLDPPTEEIDLGGRDVSDASLAPPPRKLSATLAGFHHLHLPARTMWHELLCVMPEGATPHQHTPENEEEIDRWLISAIRYLRSEFQTYV